MGSYYVHTVQTMGGLFFIIDLYQLTKTLILCMALAVTTCHSPGRIDTEFMDNLHTCTCSIGHNVYCTKDCKVVY